MLIGVVASPAQYWQQDRRAASRRVARRAGQRTAEVSLKIGSDSSDMAAKRGAAREIARLARCTESGDVVLGVNVHN
jgi:hypothetical protein